MVLSDEKIRAYMKRLLLSRMRILCSSGFYGLLLMHMVYAIDENCETAATDGRRIFFGPKFLDELDDRELDFIMMHEILHVVLQHCFRQGDRDNERFNIACDIVVNSNILLSESMDPKAITLQKYGASMHLAPNGKEGCAYTVEQVYNMLPPCADRKSKPGKKQGKPQNADTVWDDHTRWGMDAENEALRDVWTKRFEDACAAVSIRDPSGQSGCLPLFAERLLMKLKKPQTDWRLILQDFIREEIVDYSFTPPDRRFCESPFFLPDFNDKADFAEDILFVIDTSGSMSDDGITAAYAEVKGAVDQFDGKLKGWLGFFDAAVVAPKPFSDEADFKAIKPAGGGGTDFQVIFEYVQTHMQEKPPACMIILTDGLAPFPDERQVGGIPVLWLLNNDEVTPPFGRIARITV